MSVVTELGSHFCGELFCCLCDHCDASSSFFLEVPENLARNFSSRLFKAPGILAARLRPPAIIPPAISLSPQGSTLVAGALKLRYLPANISGTVVTAPIRRISSQVMGSSSANLRSSKPAFVIIVNLLVSSLRILPHLGAIGVGGDRVKTMYVRALALCGRVADRIL